MAKGDIIKVGDLDTVLSMEEKRGGSNVNEASREALEEMITDWDIMDVKPKKGNKPGLTEV